MNLKRTLFTGVALMLLVGSTRVDAQIWSEYDIEIVNRVFQPLVGGTVIPRSQFVDQFNLFVNPDDGVTQTPLPLGFNIEYDGQLFDRIYVSINGFATFDRQFISNDPITLFRPTNGPNLTLAPFFGDHYYRTAGIDLQDPAGRPFTPTQIKWSQFPASADPEGRERRSFVVEWENLNINYFFDPNDPDNPFSPNRASQAPSIATFQLWIFEAPPASISRRGTIEFHYGDAGTGSGVSIVKFSGASVGIEDEPEVPNGNTTWINGVTFAETGDAVLARTDQRLTSNWPPSGLPGRAFVFRGDTAGGLPGWGDGDANLTQLDPTVPDFVRGDQRLFVTMADVMRILRHQAGRAVDFDSARFRHGYHGDVNHNGRFYYSTSNWNNTGDSIVNGQVVRYRVEWPFKSTNERLPFPNDNTFNGFYFDADEFDASLIMLYLAAKLPQLPWLPDTLPHFTGKVAPVAPATGLQLKTAGTVTGRTVEIPVRLNGAMRGAVGLRLDLGEGTRVLDVYTPEENDLRVSLAAAGHQTISIAAAGTYGPDDVIATIVLEADENGYVDFSGITFNEQELGATRLNVYGRSATAGELLLTSVAPNPTIAGSATTIEYNVNAQGPVRVGIYDMLGNRIATLVEADLSAGTYSSEWNGRNGAGSAVAAGTYLVRLESAGGTAVLPVQVAR